MKPSTTTAAATGAACPDRFLCPLTLSPMKHPYRDTKSHQVFEREAILQWMWSHGTCPLTRKPLHLSDFELDFTLQREIQEWKAISNWEDSSHNNDDGEVEDYYEYQEEEEERFLAEEQRKKDELIRQRAQAQRERLIKRRNEDPSSYPLPEVPGYLQYYV